MADIKSNTIQNVAKVIESAQSGYAPAGLSARAQSSSNTQSIVLSVVNVRDGQILLQDQNSGKRFAIDKQALQGPAVSSLNRGDRLVLLASSAELASFSVEKARAANANASNRSTIQLTPNLAQSLAAQWPDISASNLRKIAPNVLNQVSVLQGTQSALNLSNALIDIANKTNQPILTVKLDAKVMSMTNNSIQIAVNAGNSTAGHAGASNKVSGNAGQLLSLPLNNELNAKLALGAKIIITFNASDLSKLIQNISFGSQQSISQQSLASINQSLASQTASNKAILSQILFSANNKQNSDWVFVPTKENLQLLNPSIKSALLANTSPDLLKDARLIANQDGAGPSQNKITLSLLAKPSIIGIDAAQLALAGEKRELKAFAELLSGATRLKVGETQVDLSKNAVLQTAKQEQNTKGQSLGSTSSSVSNNTKAEVTATVGKQLLSSLKSNITTQMMQTLSKAERTPAVVEAKLNSTLGQLKSVIDAELNQSLPNSESISKALPNIVKQLSDMHLHSGIELKTLIAKVLSQIQGAQSGAEAGATLEDDAIANISASVLKESFTQSALPNITGQNLLTQAIQPISGSQSQNSLVNGLITMLQASLQARLVAQQPSLLASIAQLSSGLANSSNAKTSRANGATGKALQDLNRLDPRGSLIAELNKVLSNHTLHKLSAAESSLQGQDTFYYALPNMLSPQHKDIEVVIKRKSAEEKQDKNKETQQHWQLSMKLDIGDSGEVLAKVKLFQEQVDLNLYASNQALKEKILDYLPYLNRRLVALGLQVKPQCYLGKIPKTLYKTDFQVVQAYA